MLKKKGGLSFKPKFARRPGPAAASQPAPASSASTTKTPTAEPAGQSQSSTPTPSAAPITETAATVTSVGTPASQASNSTQKDPQKGVEKEISQEPSVEATQIPAEPASTAQRTVEAATIPTSTISSNPAEQSVPSSSAPPSSTPQTQESVPTPAATIAAVSIPSSTSLTPVQAQKAVPTPTPTATSVSTPDPNLSPAQISTWADKFTSTAKNNALRRPLPSLTPDLNAPTAPITPITNELPSISAEKTAAIHISPSLGAAAPTKVPLGRALLSPSPFPVSDSITAIPPPDEPRTNSSVVVDPSSAPPKKKRQYRRRKAPTEAEDAGNGDGSTEPPKKKRQYRRKNASVAEGQDGAASLDVEGETPAPKRFRSRNREPTPEDAADRTIDHATTKVGDLTKDLGIGKKFKHSDVILERQRQARHDAKLRKLEKQKIAMGLIPPKETSENGSPTGTPGGARGEGDDNEDGTTPQAPKPRRKGLGFDLIDGRLTVNQSSLVIDQHAEESAVALETVEEDEFTHLVTSGSYMRASRSMGTNHWTDEETELFYHYLKMFGTDFETISHVFPGKNRRMVKLKFNREEKLRPKRLNAAIMARGQKKVPIDIEDYKAKRRDARWTTQDKFHAETERIIASQQKELEEKKKERRALGLLDDGPAAPGTPASGASNGEGEEDDDEDVGEGEGEGEAEEVEEEEEEGVEEEYGIEPAAATVKT
jgi:transcription factor TFIIIB component B''